MKKILCANLILHYPYAALLPDTFWPEFLKLDNETKHHCLRCAKYLIELGLMDPVPASAAILHDLGKRNIPLSILMKKGPLTKDEWETVKKHPEDGRDIIMNMDLPPELKKLSMDMAAYHHERWNGSGYPFGLRGEEIPRSARLMAIVDTFDAMTSKRCYQKKSSKAEALNFIRKQAGILYDPELVARIKPQKIIL